MLVEWQHKQAYIVKNCMTDIDPVREKEEKVKVNQFLLNYFLFLLYQFLVHGSILSKVCVMINHLFFYDFAVDCQV